MEQIRTYLVNLPYHVPGIASIDEDGEPMIYLNARLSIEQNRKTYDHEELHITRDDFHNDLPIDVVEGKEAETKQIDPLAEVYRRGYELYGLERDDPFWDKLFMIWAFRHHKDRYVGVINGHIDRFTKQQVGHMVKQIFDPARIA